MPNNHEPCNPSSGYPCSSCCNSPNSLLSGIQKKELEALDDGRTSLHFEKGEVIYRVGMQPSGLMCLSKGKVMVVEKDINENKIVSHLHKEVSFLGLADFFSNVPYQSDVIALEDSKVCMIRKDHVHELITANPFFLRRVMEEIASQLRSSHRRLLSLTKKQMQARLAGALLEIHDTFGTKLDGQTLSTYMKRKDLALLCNMNVANVIRHLSSFQDEGIIEIHRKEIKIQDINELRSIAEVR